MNIITKENLHDFFKNLDLIMQTGNFDNVKDLAESYFNNLRTFYNFENFSSLLKTTNFNKQQQSIILDYFKNGKDISDILAFKIAGFSFNDINTNSFIRSFEEQIFTKEFYHNINRKIDDFEVKNNLIDSILFIRENILPNTNAEVCAKFYIYIFSGNLENDLLTDKVFLSSINTENFKKILLEKIALRLEFWKLEKDKSNDLNVSIKKQSPNYLYYDFNYGLPDGGLYKAVLQNTPPGYIDVVMRSPDNKKIFIARVNNNRPESDIFNHLNNRLIEEAAISAMCHNKEEEIVLVDFCKGHSQKLIRKFTGNNLDTEELIELKKIFDIILHKAVSEITGYDPIIIQLGDTKYNIEQEDFLDLSIKMTNLIKNKNIDFNFDNKFIMEILQKTTEWMTYNLMQNENFYTEENILKCNYYLSNLYEIINNNSIIKNSLDKEIDHLEGKLNNLKNSQIKLKIESENKRILRRLKYLENNGILSFINHEDMNYFTKLRNITLDNISNLSYVLLDDIKKIEERPLNQLKFLVNSRNNQYDLYDKILNIEAMQRDKISQSTLNLIRKNDPLIIFLYSLKDDFIDFQNTYSIETAEKLCDSFKILIEFLEQKGEIYNYFFEKNKYTTMSAFQMAEDFFERDCNFKDNLNLLNEFKEKMSHKLNVLNIILNKEKEELEKELEKNKEIRNKFKNKENITLEEISKIKKINRIRI